MLYHRAVKNTQPKPRHHTRVEVQHWPDGRIQVSITSRAESYLHTLSTTHAGNQQKESLQTIKHLRVLSRRNCFAHASLRLRGMLGRRNHEEEIWRHYIGQINPVDLPPTDTKHSTSYHAISHQHQTFSLCIIRESDARSDSGSNTKSGVSCYCTL